MNNVSDIKNCYGCGLCAVVCKRNIISIKLSDEGFYVPVIEDTDRCTNCGLCISVCSYVHEGLSGPGKPLKSYAAWSNSKEVRYSCSSGGIAFELTKYFLEKGYDCCGVRYNIERGIAEHYLTSSSVDILKFKGSKYIQSYTVDAFSKINSNKKNIVFGTPCQIDSFRRYIKLIGKEDNFILVDVSCYGVPSMFIWKKYLKNVNCQEIGFVGWRNKAAGWHDSYGMLIKDVKGNVCIDSKLSKGDRFLKMFIGATCFNKACYDKCKFRYDKSSADIRLCDMWGSVYADNNEGVSGVVAFSKKGIESIVSLKNCFFKEYPVEVVFAGQSKKNLNPLKKREVLMRMLRNERTSLNKIYRISNFYRKLHKWINILTGKK